MLLKNIFIKTCLNNLRFLSSSVKFPLLKNKIKGFKNTAGRNNLGKITSYHKGGGHKKKYRILSNLKYLDNLLGIVMSIEYDPNRTSKIASVYCANSKKYFYIIASTHLKIGHIIRAGKNSLTRSAHSMPLKRIPLGSYVYNLTLKNNRKKTGIIARSAGSHAQLIEKNSTSALVKIPSGKQLTLSLEEFCNLGRVSNEHFWLKKKTKAGQSRWMNIRPTVRGVAMNPVDHPHGGGEGKKSKKVAPRTPWGSFVKKGKLNK